MRISDWSSDVCSSDLHRCIIPRDGKIDLQGLEIAIVYPEKATLELQRLLHFGWIVDLHQNIHAQLECGGFQLAHLQKVQTGDDPQYPRSEEHTSPLQSILRLSYAVFSFKQNKPLTT